MAAGFESRFAVRRADGDEDARLADFEAAEAMGNSDTVNREERVERGCDFAHFFEGHGLVGFVFEIEGFAAVGLIADAAVEGNDSAIFGLADVFDESIGGDRIANEENKVVVGGKGHEMD